jgi:glycosyltransferase involved in cell wall biosynthesis
MRSESIDNYHQIADTVLNPGMIGRYLLLTSEGIIRELKPDVIYCQAELASLQCSHATRIANSLKIPLFIFLWENIFSPKGEEQMQILSIAKGIFCGSKDAYNLIPDEFKPKVKIIPQVGIDTKMFRPDPAIEKKYDLVFCGRLDVSKGIVLIEEGCKNLGLRLKIINGVEYKAIPSLLNEGRIFASLPIESATWKEQSGSYAIMEAMSCGLPAITTRCGAIPEYLKDSVLYCIPELDSFKETVKEMLDQDVYDEFVNKAIQKASEYDNEIIAKKLYDNILEFLNGKLKA